MQYFHSDTLLYPKWIVLLILLKFLFHSDKAVIPLFFVSSYYSAMEYLLFNEYVT